MYIRHRKFHHLFLVAAGFFAVLIPAFASAGVMEEKLAGFFGVTPDRIFIECPQNSYALTGEGASQNLRVCLNRADHEKRCEITVHGLSLAPNVNAVSFQVKIADTVPHNEFHGVLQVHSFPDKGTAEKWRCPVMSLETADGKFRMFDRWDATPVSITSGYNCTEPGSTISGRDVLRDVKITPGEWQDFSMMTKLSYQDDGVLQASIDNKSSLLIKGPNTFNDKRDPFLKFGIYKPTGWEKGHDLSCVSYRNVKIDTGGAHDAP